jgi:uncharacterized protein (TIGR04255 family)
VEYQYENDPIKEALIDIRVEPLPQSMRPALGDLYEQVNGQYPDKQEQFVVGAQLSFGSEVTSQTSQTPIGFAFRSKDGKQIFQARLNGFTFSRLRPYGNWHDLREQGRKLWALYRAAIGPQNVTRVAMRYINQIDIPVRSIDYKDYFLTTPEVSRELPQMLSGFFMQLQMPQPDLQGMLILTQAAVAPSAPDTNSVILDLDVFQDAPELTSDDQVWDVLEKLRERKNSYFEGCLTDKTRALFGKKRTY